MSAEREPCSCRLVHSYRAGCKLGFVPTAQVAQLQPQWRTGSTIGCLTVLSFRSPVDCAIALWSHPIVLLSFPLDLYKDRTPIAALLPHPSLHQPQVAFLLPKSGIIRSVFSCAEAAWAYSASRLGSDLNGILFSNSILEPRMKQMRLQAQVQSSQSRPVCDVPRI